MIYYEEAKKGTPLLFCDLNQNALKVKKERALYINLAVGQSLPFSHIAEKSNIYKKKEPPVNIFFYSQK